MSTQLAPSGRKGSKKVRTGCLTCKIRKVKCDEGRPSCLRCIKAQRKCDGYRDTQSPARTSQSLAIRTQSRRVDESSPTPAIILPAWAVAAEPIEVQAFDYYVKRAAPFLSAEFDSYFWSGLVPRLCQAEPAVRHAVFSLGTLYRALDENLALPPPSSPRRDFALQEYNKAISCLLSLDAGRNSGQDPSAIYLLTCVLFICIEFLLWDDASSLAHIHQGRQLLCRIDEGTTRVSAPQLEMIKRYLVPIFSRLALTSFTNGANPIAIPKGMIECPTIPDEFRSISDARVCLYTIMDDGLRFSRQVRPVALGDQNGIMPDADMLALVAEQREILSRLAAWNVAFSLYLSGAARVNEGGHTYGEQMMQVHFHTAYIWVSCALSPQDSTYDEYLEHFAHIVRIASSMQGSSASQHRAAPSTQGSTQQGPSPIPLHGLGSSASSSCASRQGSPSSSPFQSPPQSPFTPFTFDDNLIPAVYYTAIKCRHPTLRRTALAMLRNAALTKPREGLWDARYVARVAERVIQLEEEGVVAQSDVCELRVRAPYPHPAHNGLTGRERLPVDLEEPRIEEWFDIMSEDNTASHGMGQQSQSVRSIEDTSSNVATSHLPPFGVAEEARVRNTIIGPKTEGGTWITIFTKPHGLAGEWDVKKEFLTVQTQ